MFASNEEWAVFFRARFTFFNKPIIKYIKSSIWPRIKVNLNSVMSNSIWQLGDGRSINFWLDNWLGRPLVDYMPIPIHLHKLLKASLADFIHENKWMIPAPLLSHFPEIANDIRQIIIPKFCAADQLVWKHSISASLALKYAFLHFKPSMPVVPWCNLIWNSFIPPSKSFIAWRLICNRMPTDDNFHKRGCVTVSICSLCYKDAESSYHLFLNCQFKKSLWLWLDSSLQMSIDTSSLEALFSICNKGWSMQMKDVICAAFINILWIIWFSRNKFRFDNKVVSFKIATSMVVASISPTGNLSKNSISVSVQEHSF